MPPGPVALTRWRNLCDQSTAASPDYAVGSQTHTFVLKVNAERLYTEAPYLLEADDFDYEIAGAWLAGQDVAITLSKTSEHSVTLVETAQNILEKEIDPDGRLKLVGETMRDAE